MHHARHVIHRVRVWARGRRRGLPPTVSLRPTPFTNGIKLIDHFFQRIGSPFVPLSVTAALVRLRPRPSRSPDTQT